MATTTILRLSSDSTDHEAAGSALRDAGIDVRKVASLDEAAAALRRGDASLVLCDGDALGVLRETAGADGTALPRDAARSLSHELRTPLSAMAGWLHLMESGKLDEAGRKRAIEKLRASIEDQVRTIERYLGATEQEGRRT